MICPCCEREASDVERRRRNTQYTDEELNWLESCSECYEHDWEDFREMWDEYYRSR